MIKKRRTIVLVCLLAFAALVYFLLLEKKEPGDKGQSRFSVRTFQRQTGWGYRIYQDTTAVIEQSSVPGIAGNNGFANEQDAQKTGELVIDKLEKGLFPPTIVPRELDSLHIAY